MQRSRNPMPNELRTPNKKSHNPSPKWLENPKTPKHQTANSNHPNISNTMIPQPHNNSFGHVMHNDPTMVTFRFANMLHFIISQRRICSHGGGTNAMAPRSQFEYFWYFTPNDFTITDPSSLGFQTWWFHNPNQMIWKSPPQMIPRSQTQWYENFKPNASYNPKPNDLKIFSPAAAQSQIQRPVNPT